MAQKAAEEVAKKTAEAKKAEEEAKKAIAAAAEEKQKAAVAAAKAEAEKKLNTLNQKPTPAPAQQPAPKKVHYFSPKDPEYKISDISDYSQTLGQVKQQEQKAAVVDAPKGLEIETSALDDDIPASAPPKAPEPAPTPKPVEAPKPIEKKPEPKKSGGLEIESDSLFDEEIVAPVSVP